MKFHLVGFVFFSIGFLQGALSQETATGRGNRSGSVRGGSVAYSLAVDPGYRYSVARCGSNLQPPVFARCTSLRIPPDLGLNSMSRPCPSATLLRSSFIENDQLPRSCIVAALRNSGNLGRSPCSGPGNVGGQVCNDQSYVDLVYESFTSILKCAQSIYPQAQSVLSERTLFGKIVNESGFQLTAYGYGSGYGIAQFTPAADTINEGESGFRFGGVKRAMLVSSNPYCKYASRFVSRANSFKAVGCKNERCESCGVYQFPSNPAASFISMVALTLENFSFTQSRGNQLGIAIQRICRDSGSMLARDIQSSPVEKNIFCNKLRANMTMLAYNMGFSAAEKALSEFIRGFPPGMLVSHSNFEVYLAKGNLLTSSVSGNAKLPASRNFSEFLVQMQREGRGKGTPSYLSQALTKLVAAENLVGGVGTCGNRKFFTR